MSVIFEAENYRGLKKVRWAPSGVCALVGPNGSGKTTLLRLGGLFRYTVERTLNEGLAVSGGSLGLKHFDAKDTDSITLRATLDSSSYQLRIQHTGFGIEVEESFFCGSTRILHRPFLASRFEFDGQSLPIDLDRMCLKLVADRFDDQRVVPVLTGLRQYRTYRDYRIEYLRDSGSATTGETVLSLQGANVFSVLRNVRDNFGSRDRFQFIMAAMRTAFPGAFHDLAFSTSGPRTHAMFLSRIGSDALPFSSAPNGVLCGLLHLVAVVCGETPCHIALDEFENSLHPHAIRSIIGSIREWCEDKDITVVLATHSPVVMDEFNDEKESLFVMQPGREVQPAAVTELADREWLDQFALGRLYTGGEIGSPNKGKPKPEPTAA